MFDTFLINAVLAGVGVAIATGVMGCFVVWKKMAYFGDSLSHSTLTGVALGLIFGFTTDISVILFCLLFTLFLIYIKSKNVLSVDTLLGVLSHSTLALGIILISIMHNKIDIYSYLFGDILTVTEEKIWLIYICSFFVLGILIWKWSSFLLITIDESLAMAENINVFVMNLVLMMLVTIVIAISIRVVGVLLISSMLIMPAAAARQLTFSPISMAIISSLIGVLSVVLGIFGSVLYDVPSGPAIVVCLAIIFVISLFINNILLKKN